MSVGGRLRLEPLRANKHRGRKRALANSSSSGSQEQMFGGKQQIPHGEANDQ